VAIDATRDFIEQFMQFHEARTLDVPVRLFYRKSQCDGVCQPLSEQTRDFAAGLGGQVVSSAVHGCSP
jgi:hypothetical protein